ncbi:MAG: phosphodiester glycosidase family protein, partial [Candidatus Marinimicrobia bacterium]|nr:phosphodiester glycosidase family protein [Candidatus Neomarinimicrobiota bacterium]
IPMKKSALFLSVLLLVFSSCSTSVQFLSKDQSERIHPDIEWKVIQSGNWNGKAASINILDVDMNRFDGDFALAWYRDSLVRTSEIAEARQGIAAINGSFFDMRKGGSVLFLQENGIMVAETQDRAAFVNEGAYAVDTAGTLMILKKAEDRDWSYSPAFRDILVSGPLLIHDGELCTPERIPFNLNRHPRTAIGITDENHFLLVTVDGRHAEAAGMNMWELRDLMESLACRYALNFDGGGSTTMYIRGKGVVNYPSDNRKFDHDGERRISNAILVIP